MSGKTLKRYVMIGLFCVIVIALIYQFSYPTCFSSQSPQNQWIAPERFIVRNDEKSGKSHKYLYNRYMPLIFIGGMPRSGTTLLRVLLDSHPDIRCGEETRVVPKILEVSNKWIAKEFESRRLQEAGITHEVMDLAVGAFILEIIAKHGSPAPRLCYKNSVVMNSAIRLRHIFPNSKFIFMIRDGRAVVHSVVHKNKIPAFNSRKFQLSLMEWDQSIGGMHYQCQQLGTDVCLPILYEQLVLKPKKCLQKVLKFLGIAWNNSIESSIDRELKPKRIVGLYRWVGQIPKDVVKDMPNIAPMLSVLGYDPNANPPNYEPLDN